MLEDVFAIKEQLNVTANGQTHVVWATAQTVAGGPQMRGRIARGHVNFFISQARVQGVEQVVEAGAPNVHGAEHVILIGLGHQFGGELFAHAGKRHVLVFHLDAGLRFEFGQARFVGTELGCHHTQDVDRLTREGFARFEHRTLSVGAQTISPQCISAGPLHPLSAF